MYLSYFWWLLEPILFVAVFYVVFSFLLDRGTENFVFFLMCGKIPYLWLSKSIITSSNSILQNRGMIASIQIPKVIFPYIAVQEVLYKQWVVFLMLSLIAIYFGSYPTFNWFWLVPIIATTYLMIVAGSLIGSLLVTYVQDFRIVIGMMMMLLMFSSGIFWDINSIGDKFWRETILLVNPLAFLVDAYRSVLMYDSSVDTSHLLTLALFFMALILLLHMVFAKLNSKLTQLVLQS
jgi:lipopolysaccharide transport system permease protein